MREHNISFFLLYSNTLLHKRRRKSSVLKVRVGEVKRGKEGGGIQSQRVCFVLEKRGKEVGRASFIPPRQFIITSTVNLQTEASFMNVKFLHPTFVV